MNLYLISQTVNLTYAYDSAVVCAESEDEARKIHPASDDGGTPVDSGLWWAAPEQVTVRLIGVADSVVARGVVCASFNGD